MKKFSLILLFIFPQTVFADFEYSSYFTQCMDESGGVTSEMMDCIGVETQYQDDRLNRAYKKLQQKLSQNEKIKLRDEQRAWIKSRDRKVNKIYDSEGGTMAGLNGSSLYLELTSKQADKLEHRLKN